jgi:hypothetical protein
LGTLCTPYLGGEWITFLSKTGHPLRYSVIAEFQPATILQYSTVFVLLLLVFLIVVAFTTRAVPRFGRTVLGGGMVIAGLTAVKFLPFAAIVLGALVCQWWSSVSPHIKGDGEEITPGIPEGLLRAKAWSSSLSPMTHGALAFLLFAVSLANISSLRKHPIDLTYVPKAAVDYIKEKSLQIPILNEFGSGGYLMYRFSSQEGMPEFRVGRCIKRASLGSWGGVNLYRGSNQKQFCGVREVHLWHFCMRVSSGVAFFQAGRRKVIM